MTKKISQTILSVGLAVVILSTALFCAALTGHFTERVFRELEAEAELGAPGGPRGGGPGRGGPAPPPPGTGGAATEPFSMTPRPTRTLWRTIWPGRRSRRR